MMMSAEDIREKICLSHCRQFANIALVSKWATLFTYSFCLDGSIISTFHISIPCSQFTALYVAPHCSSQEGLENYSLNQSKQTQNTCTRSLPTINCCTSHTDFVHLTRSLLHFSLTPALLMLHNQLSGHQHRFSVIYYLYKS